MIEPQIKLSTIHRISVDLSEVHILVDVDEYGNLGVISAFGFGDIDLNPKDRSKRAENFMNRQSIYTYLQEFELVTWRQIGPEDSEIFATKKLDPEFGLEIQD